MGQKDQDGYYAGKCHFFQCRSLNRPIQKQAQSKVKTCSALFYLVIILKQNWAGYTRGPPGGRGAKGPNQ